MKKNKLINELPDWSIAQHVISAYEVINERGGFTTDRIENNAVKTRLELITQFNEHIETEDFGKRFFKDWKKELIDLSAVALMLITVIVLPNNSTPLIILQLCLLIPCFIVLHKLTKAMEKKYNKIHRENRNFSADQHRKNL